jgi:GTP-binding protein EngB required for normal cell division
MAEPTTRELYDIINEMRIQIGVMNTKMDYVMDSKKTAERAESKADRALMIADDLTQEVDRMRNTTKWAVGLTIGSLLTAAGIVVSIVF